MGDDEINVVTNEVGNEFRRGGQTIAEPSVLDCHVLAYRETELTKAIAKFLLVHLRKVRADRNTADSGNLCRRLCRGDERRADNGDKPRQEGSPVHQASAERTGRTPGL